MSTKTRNKFEKKLEDHLKRAKISFKYEARKIPYIYSGHYTPDFEIVTPTGILIVEGKGYFRPEDKRKMIAVKKCNPHLDIRIVFYAYSKKNVTWALRNGFRYAIGTIPAEWLKGM